MCAGNRTSPRRRRSWRSVTREGPNVLQRHAQESKHCLHGARSVQHTRNGGTARRAAKGGGRQLSAAATAAATACTFAQCNCRPEHRCYCVPRRGVRQQALVLHVLRLHAVMNSQKLLNLDLHAHGFIHTRVPSSSAYISVPSNARAVVQMMQQPVSLAEAHTSLSAVLTLPVRRQLGIRAGQTFAPSFALYNVMMASSVQCALHHRALCLCCVVASDRFKQIDWNF